MFNVTKEIQTDILVIGAGGSGLVAAARAAQQSGKRVTLLEKTSRIGGAALHAVYMQTFDSLWQSKRGLASRTADYLRSVQNFMHWRVEPMLAYNAVKATGEFIDWLIQEEPELENYFQTGRYIFANEFDPVGPQAGFDMPQQFGHVVVEALIRICQRYGVRCLTECRAMDMEMKDGRVNAVIAQSLRGYTRIICESCILSSGSWIHNKKVTERVCPGFDVSLLDSTEHLNPAYTGDGVELAEKAGAFLDWDSFIIGFKSTSGLTMPALLRGLIYSPYAIEVNLDGKRFCCEPVLSMPFGADGLVQYHQLYGMSFCVMNQRVLEISLQIMLDSRRPDEAELFEFADVEQAKAELERLLKSKFPGFYREESLEVLADKLGVDKPQFLATVAEYNRSCRDGADWNYLKEKEHLESLDEGPFYAIRRSVETLGTSGGVLVDADMRAWKEEKTGVIENLFVTGDFASGNFICMGEEKRSLLGDLPWALASGFVAGSRAAKIES